MSSKEIVPININQDQKQVSIPASIIELPLYFAELQIQDPSNESGWLLEYSSSKLVTELDSMSHLSSTGVTEFSTIPLNPSGSRYSPNDPKFLDNSWDQDAFFLFEKDGQHPARELMNRAYDFTHADVVMDTRSIRSDYQYGYVVLHGTHNGGHVYFMEYYCPSDKGNYMVWGVASGIPEAAYAAPPTRTRNQQESNNLRDLVSRDIIDLGNIGLEGYRDAA